MAREGGALTTSKGTDEHGESSRIKSGRRLIHPLHYHLDVLKGVGIKGADVFDSSEDLLETIGGERASSSLPRAKFFKHTFDVLLLNAPLDLLTQSHFIWCQRRHPRVQSTSQDDPQRLWKRSILRHFPSPTCLAPQQATTSEISHPPHPHRNDSPSPPLTHLPLKYHFNEFLKERTKEMVLCSDWLIGLVLGEPS